MLNPSLLLHWHYLIFLVPFGVAALLLLLSTFRFSHHSGVHSMHGGISASGGHGHIGGGHAAAHSPMHAAGHAAGNAPAHAAGHHAAADNQKAGSSHRAAGKAADAQAQTMLAIFGVGRAPLPMVLQAFFLVWGLSGCIAAQQLLRDNHSPTLIQVLPVMAIAAGCGVVGARLASELISRLMPTEETSVVSRNGLFGLKGNVAYVVSESSGRIMIYDDYGSLHDESCRVSPGHPPIERGRRAIVVDSDTRGNLLVEEVVE